MWCQGRGGSFLRAPAHQGYRHLDDPVGRGFSGDAALLPAVDLDRVGEGGDPDGNDRDVDQNSERTADAHGPEERLHVRDEDDAADGGAEDAGRQDAHDVGGYRGGYAAAEQERPDDSPRDLGEGEGQEKADARAEGDEELAGIDSADDLARLHTSGREQRRRGDWAPSPAASGIEEPGYQAEWSQETPGVWPDLDGTLVAPEGEAGEHEHAEPEQEDGYDRLCRFGGDERTQHHSAKERPYRARYGERPDFRPVYVPESPVGGAGCRRRAYLGEVHARRCKCRRDANRQQQALRRHPVSHAKRPIDQLRNKAHDRQQQEISHLPRPSTLHLVYYFYLVYHFDVKYVAYNRVSEGLCQDSGRQRCPNS